MIDGSRCPACQRVSVPPEPRCLACRTGTEPCTVEPRARVLGRTRTDEAGPWVALVELGDDARALATSSHEPRIGAEVPLGATEDGLRIPDER